MRLYTNRNRPSHLGPLPLERLARAPFTEAATIPPLPADLAGAPADSVVHVIPEYSALFSKFFTGNPARAKAPVPDDPQARANNLKATAYFLDAIAAGCCEIDARKLGAGSNPDHRYAFVFLVEFGREPEPGGPGDAWIRGANAARTDLRTSELAAVLSGYVRWLGWSAEASKTRTSR